MKDVGSHSDDVEVVNHVQKSKAGFDTIGPLRNGKEKDYENNDKADT